MSAPQPTDRRRYYAIIAVCMVAVIVLGLWGAATILPLAMVWATDVFAPGLGLRSAAIIAAVVAFVVLIALTVTAGDGLLGEIQFVIPGFFLFFLFFWLMAAWVF